MSSDLRNAYQRGVSSGKICFNSAHIIPTQNDLNIDVLWAIIILGFSFRKRDLLHGVPILNFNAAFNCSVPLCLLYLNASLLMYPIISPYLRRYTERKVCSKMEPLQECTAAFHKSCTEPCTLKTQCVAPSYDPSRNHSTRSSRPPPPSKLLKRFP